MPDEADFYYCPQCGYDLRGQTVNRCPECGFLYDEPALKSMARDSFHSCIGPYLSALPLLLWSGSLLLGRAVGSVGRWAWMGSLVVILLTPFARAKLEEMILIEPRDRRSGWKRGFDDYASLRWIRFPDTYAGWEHVLGLVLLVVVFSRVIVAVVSGNLLAGGCWHMLSGMMTERALEQANQHLAMGPHRADALRSARVACWLLAVFGVMLWALVVMG